MPEITERKIEKKMLFAKDDYQSKAIETFINEQYKWFFGEITKIFHEASDYGSIGIICIICKNGRRYDIKLDGFNLNHYMVGSIVSQINDFIAKEVPYTDRKMREKYGKSN